MLLLPSIIQVISDHVIIFFYAGNTLRLGGNGAAGATLW